VIIKTASRAIDVSFAFREVAPIIGSPSLSRLVRSFSRGASFSALDPSFTADINS
jgi:hypothetical protein